jgi:hypothetical protein
MSLANGKLGLNCYCDERLVRLQAKFRLEILKQKNLSQSKIITGLKSITFLKKCKLAIIKFMRLGWVCVDDVGGARNLC